MSARLILSRFVASSDGTIAILWGVSIVVFFGLAGLIFDIGRLGALQGELQAFADNVALAAAGELDGQDDSITRANAAAANLITDSQTFGSGTRTLSGSVDVTLNFHSDLPASDLTPLGADATTDPLQAAFVQVEVFPRSLPMAFVSALERLLGQGNDPVIAQVGAEAVAGFTQDACDITPLMFCLPSADFTARPGAANSAVGRMIRIRSGGQGAAWGPGDFGFLDPSNADLGATCSGKNGVNLIACLVGAELHVTQCYSQRGVDTEPGQKVGIEDAIFNVRFDIYKSTMNGEKNSPDYPPAPNVLSGLVPKGGKSCIGQQEQISPDTLALPRDNCFASNSCDENNRFGDGD
ncbi:MAG: pilus assembly protein TadG-related protein, partial [Paracoccaceae bacterium]